MLGINRALAEIGARALTDPSSDGWIGLCAQRTHIQTVLWLSDLRGARLEALGKLPVSVFRVSFKTLDVERTNLSDEAFRRGCLMNTMLMEASNFVYRNRLMPQTAIGMDAKAFSRFSNSEFLERQLMVSRGGFSFVTRVSLPRLLLNPSCKASMLSDTVRVLQADLRNHMGADSSLVAPFQAAVGLVADFDRSAQAAEDIAEIMVCAGIQTKLTHSFTGLPETDVELIKRRLKRAGGNPALMARAGRIPSPATIVRDAPMHTLLFMCCYMLIALECTRKVNAKALIEAYQQYQAIVAHLDIFRHETVCINSAYRLANGLKARELWIEGCANCGELMIATTESAPRCQWCCEHGTKKATA